MQLKQLIYLLTNIFPVYAHKINKSLFFPEEVDAAVRETGSNPPRHPFYPCLIRDSKLFAREPVGMPNWEEVVPGMPAIFARIPDSDTTLAGVQRSSGRSILLFSFFLTSFIQKTGQIWTGELDSIWPVYNIKQSFS